MGSTKRKHLEDPEELGILSAFISILLSLKIQDHHNYIVVRMIHILGNLQIIHPHLP